jgi:transcriptional antiterminator
MGRRKKNYQDPISTFKRLFGVKPATFTKMKEILQKEYDKMHKKGGSPPKVSVEDKLMITLKYLREYRTMEHIGYDYGISKSTVCESIQWVENTLKKNGAFKLRGKKALEEAPGVNDFTVGEVTESPIERRKKNKKSIIPGKRSVIR